MKLRNRFTGAAAAAISATGLLVGLMSVSSTALAASSEIYNWQNVRIDGGGFVPGIVFNQKEQDLIYARTDIGGAYRWNAATSSWVPLLDWVGWDNWGWNGVLSLATDPVDTNRVYVAAGMYTNSWDPNNGAILRSTDKGATWKSTPLPFKVGGNMPGRGQGERLVIDPNKNNIIYFGAEGGNGLWRSTDYGVTWAKVSSFTNGGTYAQDPTDTYGYLSQLQGVTWVTFDPSSGSAGSASQTIYVGVADKANPVYRSTDGGATWAPLAGTPTNYLAHKGVYDAVNKFLYISTSDTGGPYDGAKGEVWKLNTQTGVWTNISPVALTSSDLYFGYSGLTIDRKNPQTIMVASQVAWWPDAIFFRSTNGGATWTRIWDWNGYPSRSFRYTQDITENPWLNFGVTSPVAPETSPKLGWMNESLEIDPFNSNRLMYGTGATLYATDNLTNWDAGTQILIKPRAKGIEETAVLDLVSPPTGAPLYSALGDIAGFRHDDLMKVPAYNYTSPIHTSTTSIDYAELNPSIMVRVGNTGSTGGVGITTSSGNSWWAGQAPSGVTGGGNVALAADGGSIVWSPGGIAVQMSTTFGSTWVASTGVPTGATVESDRVNPAKFYAVSGSSFYVSTNKGASFTATAGAGMPAATRKFKAVYGREGDIWLASDTDTAGGLYHSTDSGASFTKIATVDKADNVSFGKAAPNQAYPAIYMVGQVDGVRGVFRSNDAAVSWVRINDDQHQYGNFGDALSGDPRVYGRVYIGTNGRGIIWGDSTTVSSASSSSVVTTSTSSSVKTSSSTSSSTSSVATSTSSPATSTSSSVKTSSSAPSSTSSSTSSSSSSTCAAAQCNWYGTYYPVCVTTTSGWGYENGKSCIATSTCNSQPAPYGVVTSACGTSSSVATSTSSSVVSTSTSSSVKTSSSTSSSTSSVKTSTSSSVVSTSSSVATSTSSAKSSSSSYSSSSSAAANKCQYVVTNEWNTGFTAAVRITNTGTTAINGWNVSWTYSDGSSLTSAWGGTLSGTNPYAGTNLDWNKTIQPGQTVEMGVQGTKGSSTSAQVPAVTGAACN